jgi:hypothetical protein
MCVCGRAESLQEERERDGKLKPFHPTPSRFLTSPPPLCSPTSSLISPSLLSPFPNPTSNPAGSIGVVTGKFNLSELYEKVGYSKTILSKGKFAELLADNRPFTQVRGSLADVWQWLGCSVLEDRKGKVGA